MAGEGRAVTSSLRMVFDWVMMSSVIAPEEREAVRSEIRRAKFSPTVEPACSVVVRARTWLSLASTWLMAFRAAITTSNL